jgi:peptide/nickel transport system substrate-binding protein
MGKANLTRREFLRLASLGALGAVVTACGGGETPAVSDQPANGGTSTDAGAAATTDAGASGGEATPEPTAEQAAAPAADATPTREVPRGQAADVARERSLVLAFGDAGDIGIGNPYAAGFNHQRGMTALMEPLYFYSAFAGENIPWLADGEPVYNADSTDVTIKIRQGAAWSDGTPFTAKDVAFTLNMLRDEKNAALSYAKDMNLWVKDAQATDDQTVKITFNKEAPRFVFDFLAWKFDLGIFMVPEHIFKDVESVSEFLFYDPAKGWPLGTGPYKMVDWTVQQRLMDVRPDWWAAKAGLAEVPAVERVVVVPFVDATNAAQQMINNELDSSLDFRPPVIKTIVEQNPKIITHTGKDAPFGYTDWWPQSLFINNEKPPFNDPDVRRALNHAINRDQLVEIGYEGAGQASYLPFPDFPSLKPWLDASEEVLAKHPTNANDIAKAEEIMTSKGFTKNGDGLWVGQDGNTIDATIYGFDIMADYGPVLAEQLRLAGFDASFQYPPDSFTRMADGSANLYLFGFPNAIADVYASLDLMHSRNAPAAGETSTTMPNSRWKNAEFDKIVDQMAVLPVGDEKSIPLFQQALEIYLRELPHIPLVQWFHRIGMNETYWTNWPTAQNSYVNGAFWHKTFPLMLHNLKRAQG